MHLLYEKYKILKDWISPMVAEGGGGTAVFTRLEEVEEAPEVVGRVDEVVPVLTDEGVNIIRPLILLLLSWKKRRKKRSLRVRFPAAEHFGCYQVDNCLLYTSPSPRD